METVPAKTLKVGEQTATLEFLEIDKPYYTKVVALMNNGSLRTVIESRENLPLTEASPGVYTGAYQVTYQDVFPRAVIVGRLTRGLQTVDKVDVKTLVVDPALSIAVAADPSELKADEKSTSQLTITVTDANGDPVAGHKVKYLLATTSQYTGVVGGGTFAKEVGGVINESAFGETDLFGKVTATYVAGFAAKTAVVVARDMVSNSTGSGFVKTFIQASASLKLEPVLKGEAASGYEIQVTSSDAWLTADGKSQARITAKVTLHGAPVEGHKMNFDVTGGGTIRALQDATNKDGEARAVYTAGRKIGIALITASDLTARISGSVSIELRSDAPAKIAIKLDKDKLPADGRSRAELTVLVTDINDNPNENTAVEYAITEGSGRLRDDNGVTDRRGENSVEYTAGRTPGTVTFEITVRSTVPTEDELTKARGLAVAVTDFNFF